MLHSTIDFDCPYEDIVETKNHWVMEQWLHYTETFSVVLQDYKSKTGIVSILHDMRVSEMWTALRAVVMHFLRPMAENALPAAIDKVQEQLRRYSCLVEEVLALHVATGICTWSTVGEMSSIVFYSCCQCSNITLDLLQSFQHLLHTSIMCMAAHFLRPCLDHVRLPCAQRH